MKESVAGLSSPHYSRVMLLSQQLFVLHTWRTDEDEDDDYSRCFVLSEIDDDISEKMSIQYVNTHTGRFETTHGQTSPVN